MGTERAPNGDFDRLMEAAGGANNASTSSDRTNYDSWGPASLLPTLLWLDADRLEDLARAKAIGPKPSRPQASASFATLPDGGAGLRVFIVDRPDAP